MKYEILKHNQYNLDDTKKLSVCPICSESRKKKTEKCLMLDWDRGLGTCQHCGEIIQLHTYKKRKTEKTYIKPVWKNKTQLSDKVVKYFESRNISQTTLSKAKVSEGLEWMPQFKKEVQTIQFNYFINDELINIKYRGANKSFKLNKGSEMVFYNLNSIANENECYIVEGEMDCLSIIESGINNVVSVPNGATEKNINLEYLDNCIDYFIKKEKIFLCLDNDKAGKNLEKELIRRLGVEKCFYFDLEGCKDANGYHSTYGAAKLFEVLSNPIAYPISDIITLKDDGQLLDDYLINGMPRGYDIGLSKLDENFTVETGRYMVWTGIPSHGKSTTLDHFIVRWNIMHGWKVAICSPENMPAFIHKERIITKILGYKPNTPLLVNSDEYKEAKQYLDENFYFISFADGRFDLKRTLAKANELIVRKGIKCLVIDPYNKVRLKESMNKNITDYTNDYLNELDVFSRSNDIFTNLVAHPVKMQKDLAGVRTMPDFYDIKGGGEFYDMSPFGLTIHRNFEEGRTIVKVLKVKFAHLGTNNAEMKFCYNANNGRLSDVSDTDIPIYDNTNWLRQTTKEYPKVEPITEEEFYNNDGYDEPLPF